MEKDLFDSKSLKICTLIGQGCFDDVKVFLAKHKVSNETYAVKKINLESCELSFNIIQHEILMHRSFKHKNILPVVCAFVSSQYIWIVLPLMGFGSCKDLVHSRFSTGFPELAIAFILKDVVSALDYLHTRYVIHRSIKASHVLIDSSGNVVLTGLRHCFSMITQGTKLKTVHDFPSFYISSLNWASRELLEQNLAGYNTKSDIYSFGILACELANGVIPFYDMPMTQMLLNKIEGHTPTLLDVSTYAELNFFKSGATEADIPDGYRRSFSSHFHNLVKQCLSYDPKARPSASTLESHWFFKQTKSKGQQNLISLLNPLTPIEPDLYKEQTDDVEQLLSDMYIDTMDWEF